MSRFMLPMLVAVLMAAELPELITLSEAAERLHVSSKFIRRRVHDGRLKSYRVGGSVIRVNPEDVDALVQPNSPDVA